MRRPGRARAVQSGYGLFLSTKQPALYVDDFKEAVETGEVFRVARVEGQLIGDRGGGDLQVEDAGAASLAAGGGQMRRVDPAVGASACGVEGQRVEGRLGALEAILAPRPLGLIGGGVGAAGKLGRG